MRFSAEVGKSSTKKAYNTATHNIVGFCEKSPVTLLRRLLGGKRRRQVFAVHNRNILYRDTFWALCFTGTNI
jgi:hypothetical protein